MDLTRLNWTPFVTQILITLVEINWIQKMIDDCFWFRADVGNLKHKGACQKLMIG